MEIFSTRLRRAFDPAWVMARKPALLGVTFLFAGLFALPGCGKARDDAHARELAARVKTELLHAWNNYERYAWGHDALKPLSKTPHDWYGQSLLMTPVDALDTLILMKLGAEADKRARSSPLSFLSTTTFTSRTSR